nr:ThiF family adenylyltransferase [bacterium]
MRKVMIIGTGGIGSYLVDFLSRIGIYEITVFDDDKLEEKNLTYQNFMADMVGQTKVNALQNRLKVNGLKTVTQHGFQVLVEKQLKGYDLVVCCADNLAVRRLLYRQGYGDSAKIKWLDLRAQGRNAALVSYKINPDLMNTLLAGEEGSFSCQGGEWDGSPTDINCMHIAIAGMGIQWIQRWFNDNDDVIDMKMVNI